MSFERKLITGYEDRGHQVNIRLVRPDLLVEVDGKELGPFYPNVTVARAAAKRHVDDILKEKK